MTDGVRPVGPIEGHTVHERREGDRRGRDRRAAAEAATTSRAVVPAGERVDHAASPAKPAVSPSAPPALFAAQVIGQSAIAYALAHLPATFGSLGLYLQPLIAAFYAQLLLGEALQPVQIVGGIIVLVAIALARRSTPLVAA